VDQQFVNTLGKQMPNNLVLQGSVTVIIAICVGNGRRWVDCVGAGMGLGTVAHVRNVENVAEQQETVVNTVALLQRQLGVLLQNTFHVVDHSFCTFAVNERLLAGHEQLVQLEDRLLADFGLGHDLHGQEAFYGHGEIDQQSDAGVQDLRVPDIQQERDYVIFDVVAEPDRPAIGAQGVILSG
jgi:hypothetical protein